MNEISIHVRSDGKQIAHLFQQFSHRTDWNLQKWSRYYQEYPIGTPMSICAFHGEEIIGHVGLLQVTVGQLPAFLQVHLLIAPKYRNLSILSRLLGEAEISAKRSGAKLLCAFPNARSAPVLLKMFKWSEIAKIYFCSLQNIGFLKDERKYFFKYPEEWFKWRFGKIDSIYTKQHVRNENEYTQILKIREQSALALVKKHACIWSYENENPVISSLWFQSFQIKVLSDSVDADVYDSRHWRIDMGDSDVF